MASLGFSQIDSHARLLLQHGLKPTLNLEAALNPSHVKTVRALFVSKSFPECTVALHGTSFEVLQEILKTGLLPAETAHLKHLRGFIGIEPLYSLIQDRPEILKAIPKGYRDFMESQNEYAGYADTIAKVTAATDALMKIFRLNKNSLEDSKVVLEMINLPDKNWAGVSDLPVFREFEQRGFSMEAVKAAVGYSSNLCGFCIGLKPEVFAEYRYSQLASDGRAPHLKAPNGIGIDFITGILPMGPVEQRIRRQIEML